MRKFLKTLVSLCMVSSVITTNIVAEEVASNDGTVKYVLDANDFETFAAGAKTDGEELKGGTDNYFTILCSTKTKIDASAKTFEDGYVSKNRFNLGGKATEKKNSIMFKTANPAKVKIWWVEGGTDNRLMAIFDLEGKPVYKSEGTFTQNQAYISVFDLKDAGTYYLGGETNNNYIFKVEIIETLPIQEAVVNTYDLESSKLAAISAGAKKDGDEETAGTNDFFTIIYSAKSKVDSSSKSFDDGYASAQRINFGGVVSTAKNAIKFTTEGIAEIKVWWAAGDVNRQIGILDKNGEQVAVTSETLAKNALCISTLKLENPGTYYLGNVNNNNYIFRVQVVDTVGGKIEKPARADWSSVEVPSIESIEQDGNNILVSVNANVDYDGGDKVSVQLIGEDGKVIETKNSSRETTSHSLTFTPASSGQYTFVPVLVRENEEDKTGASKSANFILPLTKPVFGLISNNGKGSLSVNWSSVKEATGYEVSVVDSDNKVVTEGTEAILTGLTVGEQIKVQVVALRNEERTEPAVSDNITVTAEKEHAWTFSTYGTSTSKQMNGFVKNENDSITVYSEGGKGKSVPAGADGLAFYYTSIDPETENFTLRANVHVDKWTMSNGQEGFGLMVSDAVGTNGSADDFWNNQIQVIGTKVEYRYDGSKVTKSEAYPKISMLLGLGSMAKFGVTPKGIEDKFSNPKISIPTGFTSETTPLETSCGHLPTGKYNLVGNATSAVEGTIDDPITDFVMEIQRNNTGYITRYLDNDGNVIGEKLYYDLEREELTRLDENHIYVGFFAARNVRITVSNIDFTVIAPEDDEEAQEREIELVEPVYTIESATTSNTEDYNLVFYGNADGKITVKNGNNEVIAEDVEVSANTKVAIPTTISLGSNSFVLTMTPNSDYVPGEYKKLSSYESATLRLSVTRERFIGTDIYVAPNGKAKNDGSKKSPVDIQTALNYVQAGQKIILAGGTYIINGQLKAERGTNGTAEDMIYLIADPEATERPVFDFNKTGSGMVLGGNYWYCKDFDVTNTANGAKGLQLSGSNCVLDGIHTYKNGNTGLQIYRFKGTDMFEDWPHDNLVKNCVSYLNADAGYEDADGFAAKLCVGNNNVFDGCVSAYNADDGWDLFAKAATGSIGAVTIQNCVTFRNGYLLANEDGEYDLNGTKVIIAGNGNGFKMGGENLPGGHILRNSIAFENKAKGIDSNSCPDIKVYNSTSFDNGSYNVALYTNNAANTTFVAENVISFRTPSVNATAAMSDVDSFNFKGVATVTDTFKFKGNQVNNTADVINDKNYFITDVSGSKNKSGVAITVDNFENLAIDESKLLTERNEDGQFTTGDFLKVTGVEAGANLSDNSAFAKSESIVVNPEDAVTGHDGFVKESNLVYWIAPIKNTPVKVETEEVEDKTTSEAAVIKPFDNSALKAYSNFGLNVYKNSRVTSLKTTNNGFMVGGYLWIDGISPRSYEYREIVFVNAEDSSTEKAYRKVVSTFANGWLNTNMFATKNGTVDLTYANYTVEVNPKAMLTYTKSGIVPMNKGKYYVYMRISDGKNSYLFPLVDVKLSNGTSLTLPEGFEVSDDEKRTLIYNVQ